MTAHISYLCSCGARAEGSGTHEDAWGAVTAFQQLHEARGHRRVNESDFRQIKRRQRKQERAAAQ